MTFLLEPVERVGLAVDGGLGEYARGSWNDAAE